MYEILGISLMLAALLAINAGASFATIACWWVLESPARLWSARARSRFLFALRFGPPAGAFICVTLLLIPSYLVYEPHATAEVVGKKLGTIALLSAFGLALALWRGISSWLATRTLLKQWLAASQPIPIAGIGVESFRIAHGFPVIAVVGTIRPRLFVASHVLDSLSEEELRAAVAHECGHLAARDNLKRALIRVCRDLLALVPCGRTVDRAWAESAEAAADEYAAGCGRGTALNLASALIKIARLVPSGARPMMPAAAFLIGDATDGVMGRVRRLIELSSVGIGKPQRETESVSWAGRTVWFLLLAIAVLALINSPVLASFHSVMERVVQFLD